MNQDKTSIKKENKSLFTWKTFITISILTALTVVAYDNRKMLMHINAKNLSNQNTEQLLRKKDYARVSLFYHNKDSLPGLPSSCGVRSVFSALSMLWVEVDPATFVKFHKENVGYFGMSPGLMTEFLDTLKPLGVEYSIYDTSKMSEDRYRDFLINAIIDGKAPIVLIQNPDRSFHWVTIRTISTEDMAKKERQYQEKEMQTNVELIEDLEFKDGTVLPGGNKTVLSSREFYKLRKLPAGIQQATILLGVAGRTTNEVTTENMTRYPLKY